jgi:hypothetical protein
VGRVPIFFYFYIWTTEVIPYNALNSEFVNFETPVDLDWGLVVKLVLPGEVPRRAYKMFGIYDRFFTNVQFSHKF